MKPSDLCMPIYLNTDAVLDMLAILEDGFSTVRHVSNTTSAGAEKETFVGGGIGVSNLFGLLGMSLSGKKTSSVEEGATETTGTERIHTPTSLFNRLRTRLINEGLLSVFEDAVGRDRPVKTGEFIEFKAVLRKNPIVDVFEAFDSIFKLAAVFSSDREAQTAPAPGGGKKQKPVMITDSNKKLQDQLRAMLNAVTAGESLAGC